MNSIGASGNTVHLQHFYALLFEGPGARRVEGTIASLPAGSRITDYISLGVVAKALFARGRAVASGPAGEGNSGGQVGHFQARSCLGAEPLKRLYEAIVAPIAQPESKAPGTGSGGSSVWMEAHWM